MLALHMAHINGVKEAPNIAVDINTNISNNYKAGVPMLKPNTIAT
jgi:hypothetical protein